MKEKKLLIIIIILALVIVLGIGGVIAVYAFTDLLKTDKQLFFKYISKNEELIEQFNDEDLENYIKKQDNTAYSNEGKITLNTSGDSTDKTLNMLKNASITFNGGIDNVNKYRYQNINVNYSDTEKVNAEYIQLQDHYGLKINDVTNKFLAVENNNLKEWATKMGLDQEVVNNIPNKLDFNMDLLKNLFTDEEIKQIKNKYLKVIEPELTDEMFIKNKENDSNIYMLTLTENKLTNISAKLLTTLKDDELIISKIKQVLLSNPTITEESTNEYIQQFKDGIQETIDDLNNENNIVENGSTNVEHNVNIKVFAQKGKLQKTEISISNEPDKLTITNIKNGIQLEVIEDDTNVPTVLAMQKIKNSEGLTYSMVNSMDNKQTVSISMKYSGLNTEQVQEKAEINCDMSNLLNGNITLMYENTKKFDNNLQKQNITTSDMIVLNTAPNIESLSNLLTKVWERFLQVNSEHLMKAMNASQNSSNTSEEFTNTTIEGSDSTNNNANPTDNTNNNTNTSNDNTITNTSNDSNTSSTENTNNINADLSNLAGDTNTENSIDNTNTNIESNNISTNTNNITSNTNDQNNIMSYTNTNSANVTHQTTN